MGLVYSYLAGPHSKPKDYTKRSDANNSDQSDNFNTVPASSRVNMKDLSSHRQGECCLGEIVEQSARQDAVSKASPG